MSHDLKLGDGSIIKEYKYIIIGRGEKTDFVACQIKLESKKTCIPSNSGVGMKESISISGLESNVPLESKSSLGHTDKNCKHEESTTTTTTTTTTTSEQEEEYVGDDNEDERESVNNEDEEDEETAECFLHEIYCDDDDDSENIIGAKALMLLGVLLVECGTRLRKYLHQKV